MVRIVRYKHTILRKKEKKVRISRYKLPREKRVKIPRHKYTILRKMPSLQDINSEL